MSDNLTPAQRAAAVALIRSEAAMKGWYSHTAEDGCDWEECEKFRLDSIAALTAAADALEAEPGKDVEIAALAAQLVVMREALVVSQARLAVVADDLRCEVTPYLDPVVCANNVAEEALALPLPEAARAAIRKGTK